MADMINQFREEQVWDTNWKCLVENFMEGYHLSSVHQNTLQRHHANRLCKKFRVATASLATNPTFQESGRRASPTIPT